MDASVAFDIGRPWAGRWVYMLAFQLPAIQSGTEVEMSSTFIRKMGTDASAKATKTRENTFTTMFRVRWKPLRSFEVMQMPSAFEVPPYSGTVGAMGKSNTRQAGRIVVVNIGIVCFRRPEAAGVHTMWLITQYSVRGMRAWVGKAT